MCASEQFHFGLAPILTHQYQWPARENVVAFAMVSINSIYIHFY